MREMRNALKLFLIFGLFLTGSLSQVNAQPGGSQLQVNNILRNLNVKIDTFRNDLDNEYRRASTTQGDEREINRNLDNLQDSLSDFQQKVDRRTGTADDVRQILSIAKNIDDFVAQSGFPSRIQRLWTDSRDLFSQLASAYGVSPYWNSGGSPNPRRNNYPTGNPYPSDPNNSYSYGLTGTYQLDTSRSENTRDIAERAISNNGTQNANDSRRDLEEKLMSPEQLAINVQGNQVTLASSLASQITFTADGRDRNETLPDGRTLRLRTTLRGQELTVSSIGGNNDYTVIFASIENGRSLKVTRRVTTDYLNQTVFAESIYNKTDAVARFENFGTPSGNYPTATTTSSPSYDPNAPTTRPASNGNFVVPSGTILTGTLQNNVSTEYSQNNDRFRLTVTAPNQYRGAILEGYLSGINRSGKVSGRSQLTFNFDTIRLPNGNTYDFAGFLQSVTDLEGKTVNVDTEGTAKGGNQTKTTATRGAIGAGIGAIIGAIAGGGKGAAIGAIIGGAGGAGSVYVQGKKDLELKSGSSLTVQASTPRR